jgi:hypothetical protein
VTVSEHLCARTDHWHPEDRQIWVQQAQGTSVADAGDGRSPVSPLLQSAQTDAGPGTGRQVRRQGIGVGRTDNTATVERKEGGQEAPVTLKVVLRHALSRDAGIGNKVMALYRKHAGRRDFRELDTMDVAAWEQHNRRAHDIHNRMRPLEADFIQRWIEEEENEETAEMPLAAAPPEREPVVESLEPISLHMSYDGANFYFEGYIANQSGREIVVFFTDIRGDEAHARQSMVQFVISDRHLVSEPLSIQLLKENFGVRFSLGMLSETEPLDLSEMSRALQVQPVKG